MKLTNEEIGRYSRHLRLPEVGLEGQLKLKESKVLLVGAGGLGCPIGMYLGAAGIGTIGIIDFDTVDASNLQRQIDLNNAFKSFFRGDSCKPCRRIAGNRAWGAWGARMREAKRHKAWTLPRPLPEMLLRPSGKSLAQGQVALMYPT